MHDSVTVTMHAPPEQIWDLVSDVTRIGRYRPQTFEAEWLEGATRPAVGARRRLTARPHCGHPQRMERYTVISADCHAGAAHHPGNARGTQTLTPDNPAGRLQNALVGLALLRRALGRLPGQSFLPC